MWESRRDFQRVWEGWEAGFLAFHAFHTLSFPWPAFRPGDAGFTASSTSAMGRTRNELFIVIVVDECFGDLASIQLRRFRYTRLAGFIKWTQPAKVVNSGSDEFTGTDKP